MFAIGRFCTATVTYAGALSWPRSSVTTSENRMLPVVPGTLTETLDVGAVVLVLGLAVDSEMTVVAIGVTGATGTTGIKIGAGAGVGAAVGPPAVTGVPVVASAGAAPATASGAAADCAGAALLCEGELGDLAM
jgi:hypothetical protein